MESWTVDPERPSTDRVINLDRTLIIGNSGSGKSWLAGKMASARSCPHLALDDIYWENQAALHKRPHAAAKRLVSATTASPTWVIEGVFSWVIAEALHRATLLLWLDLPLEACRTGLLQRGPLPDQSPAEFDDLLAWASGYGDRRSSSSHAGHLALFEHFTGSKHALRSRREVNEFAGTLK